MICWANGDLSLERFAFCFGQHLPSYFAKPTVLCVSVCVNRNFISLIAPSSQAKWKSQTGRVILIIISLVLLIITIKLLIRRSLHCTNNNTQYAALNEEQRWNWSELDWNHLLNTPPTSSIPYPNTSPYLHLHPPFQHPPSEESLHPKENNTEPVMFFKIKLLTQDVRCIGKNKARVCLWQTDIPKHYFRPHRLLWMSWQYGLK